MFYIGLYRENMKKSSCLKPQDLESWYYLVDLYQVCSNYIHWVKHVPAPGGHMFNIGLHRENKKILLV